jgi:hypothetical protein
MNDNKGLYVIGFIIVAVLIFIGYRIVAVAIGPLRFEFEKPATPEYIAPAPLEPAATQAPAELAPTEAPVADFIEQETLTVSFQDGVSGTSTTYDYYGTVLIVAEGEGQAASAKWSDPFYIFTDMNGQKIAPWHPTEFYNWTLWINGEPVDSFIESIPPYNSNHTYKFLIYAPGGYLTFAVGDTQPSDNNGYFTITIFIQ